MSINTSPHDSTPYQHTYSRADYFGILVYVFNESLFRSNNIFLDDLCDYMIFSLIEFPVNIYIFITHGVEKVYNIHTLLTYGLSPQDMFFFQSRTNATYRNRCHVATHEPYFSHMWHSNTNITFKTNLYP